MSDTDFQRESGFQLEQMLRRAREKGRVEGAAQRLFPPELKSVRLKRCDHLDCRDEDPHGHCQGIVWYFPVEKH